MKTQDLYVGFAFAWADVLVHADADLVMRDAVGAVQSMLGCDSAALAGRPLADLFSAGDGHALNRLAKLPPGRRLTLDRLTVAGVPAPISLSAIRLDSAPESLCIGLRATTTPSESSGSSEGVVERITAFARDAYARVFGEDDASVGVVALDGVGELKARLARVDSDRLGDLLRARIGALIGADDSCLLIDDGSYAFVDSAGRDLGSFEDALQDATREIDPQKQGLKAHAGRIEQSELGQLNEGDFVNGMICSLSRFCEASENGLSLADLAANFNSVVADGVENVRAFGKLVNEGDFNAVFQPVVDARSGTIHHYEALCRFEADKSPAERLLFAEQAGMIHQFDLAMVAKVIAWLGKQPRNRRSASVAVNISGRSLEHPSFFSQLERLLDDNDWLDDRLIFEVTETARVTDLGASDKLIQRLRKRGHAVCVDDFGAGAASFQYLAELDVDIVKLDGSAVDAAARSDRGRAFLAALTEFCRRLGVHTVAEMVETRQHLQIARQCGVDYVQGYLFGKPSPRLRDFQPLPNAKVFKSGGGAKSAQMHLSA